VDDQVAFARYAAACSHALWRHAVYPPGVFGVAMWADAMQARAFADAMPAVARRTAADEARGAAMSTAELEAELDAHEAEQAAVEAALEEQEWREEERQYRLAQIDALRRSGTHGLADHLEAHGEDLAAAGLAP
jgi:hypothetical protein